jgi:hypothetical protein
VNEPKLEFDILSDNSIEDSLLVCDDPLLLIPAANLDDIEDDVDEDTTRTSGTTSTLTLPLPPLRVKRSYREMTSSMTCGVVFESDPVWLWSLRANSWATIYVTGPDESRLRQGHHDLFHRLISKMVTIPTTFRNEFPSICPDIMWISGSRSFIDMVELGGSGSHVYWMSNCPRRCPPDGTVRWSRLQHRNLGGVTEARGTFGVNVGSPELTLGRDVQRSIGHVVKYSVRPSVCDPTPSEPHYKVSDLLSLSFSRRPVVYPTYMSRTGWGSRPLTDSELSLCFELPDYLQWQDRFLRDIVPLQMFRSVIEAVVVGLAPVSPPNRNRIGHWQS